jgi:hypothetical protein
MMIELLTRTDVTDFNKDTLKKLKPYFGLELLEIGNQHIKTAMARQFIISS